MKAHPLLLATLAAVCTLTSVSASALESRSGPGMMRCTTVLGRLASSDSSDRMPVLSWAQGYLSGIAAVASAFDGTSDVEVPSYDELQPRLVALCRADPTMDLYHAARHLSSRRVSSR